MPTPVRETLATAALGEAAAPDNELLTDRLALERTVFSEDRTHRFTLFRHWGDPDDYAAAICMNPSGATAYVAARTVSRVATFARTRWGVGAFYMLNALSIRGTYSTDLNKATEVNRPENDEWIRRICANARLVVVAWGNPGADFGRDKAVEKILLEVCGPEKVFCFGRNKTTGAPVHPLYQRSDAPLLPYFAAPLVSKR